MRQMALLSIQKMFKLMGKKINTVYSRYLEFQGTEQNMSSYQYFEVTKSWHMATILGRNKSRSIRGLIDRY